MDTTRRLRPARADDLARILELWDELWAADANPAGSAWRGHAETWITDRVPGTRLTVCELAGAVVACAAGSVQQGVPGPHCPTGRSVRLENVVTDPAHRRRGHGAATVLDVVAWARDLGADRVDLGATDDGLALYERLGFVRTSAPRLKLML